MLLSYSIIINSSLYDLIIPLIAVVVPVIVVVLFLYSLYIWLVANFDESGFFYVVETHFNGMSLKRK